MYPANPCRIAENFGLESDDVRNVLAYAALHDPASMPRQ